MLRSRSAPMREMAVTSLQAKMASKSSCWLSQPSMDSRRRASPNRKCCRRRGSSSIPASSIAWAWPWKRWPASGWVVSPKKAMRQFVEMFVQGQLADHDQAGHLARLDHGAHAVLAVLVQAREQQVHALFVHRVGERTQDAQQEGVRDHLRAVTQEHDPDGLHIALAQAGGPS